LRSFTTVRDCGGADHGLAEAVEEGTIEGPRLLFVGHALSQTGGHGDMRSKGEDCFACGAALRGIGRVCDGDAEVRNKKIRVIARCSFPRSKR
jgi:imidazolonepropionase-like amidohydrolase